MRDHQRDLWSGSLRQVRARLSRDIRHALRHRARRSKSSSRCRAARGGALVRGAGLAYPLHHRLGTTCTIFFRLRFRFRCRHKNHIWLWRGGKLRNCHCQGRFDFFGIGLCHLRSRRGFGGRLRWRRYHIRQFDHDRRWRRSCEICVVACSSATSPPCGGGDGRGHKPSRRRQVFLGGQNRFRGRRHGFISAGLISRGFVSVAPCEGSPPVAEPPGAASMPTSPIFK